MPMNHKKKYYFFICNRCRDRGEGVKYPPPQYIKVWNWAPSVRINKIKIINICKFGQCKFKTTKLYFTFSNFFINHKTKFENDMLILIA